MKANRTDILKTKLQQIEATLHASGASNIQLHQQSVIKGNLSFSGGDGRIYIQPAPDDRYDVSLSGQSLQRKMSGFMDDLCERPCDGHKQTKPVAHQPYWRVADFSLAEKAIHHYSKTRGGA